MIKLTNLFRRFVNWRHIFILITLTVLTLSALPNAFRETPTVVVSNSLDNATSLNNIELRDLLEGEGFKVDTINTKARVSTIILDSTQKTELAVTQLQQSLGRDFKVESGYQNSTPQWLKALGAEPVKLGLDLSGGALFILKVDSDKAFLEQIQFIRLSVINALNERGIRGFSVNVIKHQATQASAIEVVSSNTASYLEQLQQVAGGFSGLQLDRVNPGKTILFFPEAERKKYHQEIMQQSLTVLRGRISELGIMEAVTQRQGTDKIRIELPGLKNIDDARPVIGATASLVFYQLQQKSGVFYQSESGESIEVNPIPIFSGEHIKYAQSGRDEMGRPLVNLTLDSDGGKKMLQFSSKNIGKPMATVFSEYYQNGDQQTAKRSKVISVATIQSELGARFSITNLSSTKDAQQLALLLRAGSLNAPITIVKQQAIGASLGDTNISNGLAALALGVALTFLFMALWYKRLGLIANVALVLNLICILGLMSLLPGAVLTLPGVAGLVLTVGMAVDTNVLIFERIKEEKSRGKSLPLAVEHGYRNAFGTILDANITTLITALVLFFIGYGPVKGFAITLSLGIITSLFTGVFVARTLTNLLYANHQRFAKRVGQSI